jgi:Spy/CpxP family protein refolding chaperone
MKRGLLWVALLLSVGFNLGVLASLVRDRPAEPVPAPTATAVPGEELPTGPAVITAPAQPEAPRAAPVRAAGEPATDSDPVEQVEPRPAEPNGPDRATGVASSEPADTSPRAGAALHLPPDSIPLVDRLALTGEQRLEFMRLQQQLATKVRTMQPRIARARAELYRELSAPAPDRRRIEQRVAFLGRASATLERAFADTALRSRELLDPEQEQIYLRVLSRRVRMARAGEGLRPPAARRDGGARPPGGRPRR